MGKHHTRNPATPLEIWRRTRGLSRVELGGLAGVHPETVARFERRETEPRGSTLVSLADALGVPAGALLAPAESGSGTPSA